MKTCYKTLLILLLLATTVLANNVTVLVQDINNLQPIFNASVEIKNETTLQETQFTDANGIVFFELDQMPYYWYRLTVDHPLYSEQILTNNISANTDELVSLFPISNNGLVKVVWNDMTLSGHDICIYFEENGRLKDCYMENETILLVVNKNYIARPKVGLVSQFESSKSVSNYMVYIAGFLLGILFILIILVVFIAVLRRAWKGK